MYPTLDDLASLRFQARGFSFLPKQPIHSLLAGRHASRLRGRGLTFEELRRYQPGDDIRTIDWRATARLRKTQVRAYSEERDRPVLLVVDQRMNMFFGSARTTKATTAAEAAALAAWRTIDRGDRVGAILFGDEESVEIRPHRSRNTVMQICEQLVQMNAQLSASNTSSSPEALNAALRRADQVATHDHLVILITDYDGDDEQTRKLTTRLAAHNDVLAALVYDPLGVQLPTTSSAMEATNLREQLSIPSDARFAQRYGAVFLERLEVIRQRLSAIRIPILPICTHEPVIDQVVTALGRPR